MVEVTLGFVWSVLAYNWIFSLFGVAVAILYTWAESKASKQVMAAVIEADPSLAVKINNLLEQKRKEN